MHTVLFYESFSFCSRDDLERLQPVSQSLLDIIVAGSDLLPLRPVPRVEMDFHSIRIFAKEPTEEDLAEENLSSEGYDPDPDYVASIRDGDFEETFRRLQRVCIKEFQVWSCDSPFLGYWKAMQETADFTVVRVDCKLTYDTNDVDWEAYYDGAEIDPPDTTDYDALDAIVNHLRPKTADFNVKESSWQENRHNELVSRDSFLNNLETCDVSFGQNAVPPPAFFFNEPGYPNYKVWCGDGRLMADGVNAFIESFVRDGYANEKLESVFIKWYHNDGPQPPAPKLLSEPTKTNVPPPKIDTDMVIFSDLDRVSQCDVYSFFNTMQWKLMEVYKWSVERNYMLPRTIHILLCRVQDL